MWETRWMRTEPCQRMLSTWGNQSPCTSFSLKWSSQEKSSAAIWQEGIPVTAHIAWRSGNYTLNLDHWCTESHNYVHKTPKSFYSSVFSSRPLARDRLVQLFSHRFPFTFQLDLLMFWNFLKFIYWLHFSNWLLLGEIQIAKVSCNNSGFSGFVLKSIGDICDGVFSYSVFGSVPGVISGEYLISLYEEQVASWHPSSCYRWCSWTYLWKVLKIAKQRLLLELCKRDPAWWASEHEGDEESSKLNSFPFSVLDF